ncbi:class I SAM-dependent methyltransferase [Streptomyces sp. CB01881]|uniref:class I SAM-dependent methyltransferase n=1 Tax=Streptomyces sp. CB01881 TaxID=2078691 RepID=UPI000CDC3C6E|nr:class I SAM-dependent methyltransferase [Streptomyces sp. CB01881]AUY50613.1 SAM-dependent methyltransferase [Streptomyces sp. CB01881]TYC73999.1 class I SAM-dependent methyltransferase [Streptomyces sp. CB01881]
MEAIVNTEQSQAWNGDEGRHWSEHTDRWNAVNQGFNDPLLTAAAIRPEARVLDIGCGAGQSSRLAARAARRGSVLGLDLSGPMLARARALAAEENLANLEFQQGDAQVHPLPSGTFDVALSRFGVMFFADPIAAFANIAGALRPGGRLAFVCMAEPARSDWVQLFTVLADLAPAPAPAPARDAEPGMFSFADPDRVRTVLASAGFDAVNVEAVDADGFWGRDASDAAAFALSTGPAQHLFDQLDEDAAEQARATLTRRFRAHERDSGVHLRTAAWLVTAVRG